MHPDGSDVTGVWRADEKAALCLPSLGQNLPCGRSETD